MNVLVPLYIQGVCDSPDLHDGGAVEVGPLVDAGRHQQPTVGPALDGDEVRPGIFMVYQVLCGCLEVIEYVLFVEKATRVVPSFAVLSVKEKVLISFVK